MPASGSHMRRMMALENPSATRFLARVVKFASQVAGLAA